MLLQEIRNHDNDSLNSHKKHLPKSPADKPYIKKKKKKNRVTHCIFSAQKVLLSQWLLTRCDSTHMVQIKTCNRVAHLVNKNK